MAEEKSISILILYIDLLDELLLKTVYICNTTK